MTLEFADPVLSGGPPQVRPHDRYFSAHYLTVLRLCMRQLGDVSDAEDATQETFRRAIQQGIGEVDDPLPWLLTVARNVCVDEMRRRRSGRTALERTVAGQAAPEGDDETCGNPEPVVVGRMFVDELLGKLTPAERKVVAGRFIKGQSGGEVAASMGVTASTTRVLLARAREKMRRYIESGQGMVGGACVGGMQALHSVRRRVLARSWAMQPRAELLLPALVVTAMVAPVAVPHGALPALAGTGSATRYDLVARNLDAWGAAGGHTAALAGGARSEAGGPALDPGRGSGTAAPPATPGGSPLDALLPAPDPNQVGVMDFEPSPNYRSDHTVYMVGTGNCYAWCDQLFRSSDGGATWTYMSTKGLWADQLVIPAASYGAGRFYSTGSRALQITTDGGGSFQTYATAPQFAVAAPGWLGAQVVTADVALSFIDTSPVPRVVAPFGAGMSAAGAPVLMPDASGWSALQVVQDQVLGGPDALLRCTAGGCATMTQLPLSGAVQLLASPHVDTDHTLVAIGNGVAVSHDGGASFTVVSAEPVAQAIATPGPSGTRLVAVDTAHSSGTDFMLAYSDDWGATWHPAAMTAGLARSLFVHTPRMIAPGRLIASAADPTRPGYYVFICSSDGGSWSACAPDRS